MGEKTSDALQVSQTDNDDDDDDDDGLFLLNGWPMKGVRPSQLVITCSKLTIETPE